MRLIIILLLLSPISVFSQTQTDTLSIAIIVPKLVSPTIEIVQGPLIEPMENVHSSTGKYQRKYFVSAPDKHMPVGLFEQINKPKELWFFWDLIAVRD